MSDRGGGRDRGGSGARRVSLLCRNLPLDIRQDEVRKMFERYGEVRDVYLPKDFYNGKPKGFGFIEFHDNRDAEDALHALDRSMLGGREISVVMSKESRKTPRDMIVREDTAEDRGRSGGGSRDRGGSRRRDSRSPRRDRSRSPRRDRSRSPGRERRRSPSPRRSPPRRDDRSQDRRPASVKYEEPDAGFVKRDPDADIKRETYDD